MVPQIIYGVNLAVIFRYGNFVEIKKHIKLSTTLRYMYFKFKFKFSMNVDRLLFYSTFP